MRASPRAIEHAKRALIDLLGVTVVGSMEDAGRTLLSYARSYGSIGPAAVIGTESRMAPALAALVNGTAGHALDFDDIGLGAGHVTVSIAPAILAVAEVTQAHGAEFLDALVVGYEVANRLTRMYRDTRLGPYAAGYHKPSVYSVFGATAAAARLMGLDSERTSRALGIAASQTGGLRVNFGTMTKPMHAGIANRTAVEAAQLAAEGFTASPEAIEGRFGWHDVLCRGEGDLSLIVEGLGSGFAAEEGLIYKLYPCCGANHYAIDATLGLRRDHHIAASDVCSVDVYIEARNLQEVLVYPWPRTGLEGKFSLAFNVAAAITDGSVTIDTFTDETVVRLEPLRKRIRVHAVVDLPQNGAKVVIHTNDDRSVEQEQLVLKGSLEDPLSWEELAEKFSTNCDPVVGSANSRRVVELVATLERSDAISEITELLGHPD